MPEIQVEFSMVCECGRPLNGSSEPATYRKGPIVTVEPCDVCLENARQEGRDEEK